MKTFSDDFGGRGTSNLHNRAEIRQSAPTKIASNDPIDASSNRAEPRPPPPLRHTPSYENVVAGEDYTPPWLDDPVPDSRELSFEELDAYYEPEDLRDDTDTPKVVYKEDVAALIW